VNAEQILILMARLRSEHRRSGALDRIQELLRQRQVLLEQVAEIDAALRIIRGPGPFFD
jgi:hypothetical protein